MKETIIFRDEVPGDGLWIVKLIIAASFAETVKEARQLISRGFVMVNGQRVKPDMYFKQSEIPVVIECEGRESVKFALSS